MKIEIGQVAPDFTLYDSTKNKVTLSDLNGQNVYFFFFHLHLPAHALQNYVQYEIIFLFTTT